MSSWMNVCLQLVERKLQLSGRDKSNAALVYIVPYWVHITASPSQHTLLYQVWSKIKPFESYLITVLVSAELLLGLKKYFCSKLFAQTQEIFFAQKLFAQDQNWGSELCRPRTCRTSGSRRATFATFYSRRAIMEDHTEHMLYTENQGEIWFEISASHNDNIVYSFSQERSGKCPCFRCPPLPKTFLILLSIGSWLPYSTYLYLDFHFCSMTQQGNLLVHR